MRRRRVIMISNAVLMRSKCLIPNRYRYAVGVVRSATPHFQVGQRCTGRSAVGSAVRCSDESPTPKAGVDIESVWARSIVFADDPHSAPRFDCRATFDCQGIGVSRRDGHDTRRRFSVLCRRRAKDCRHDRSQQRDRQQFDVPSHFPYQGSHDRPGLALARGSRGCRRITIPRRARRVASIPRPAAARLRRSPPATARTLASQPRQMSGPFRCSGSIPETLLTSVLQVADECR